MKSNIQAWRTLHEFGYFKNHPYYQGGNRITQPIGDLEKIGAVYDLHIPSEEIAVVLGSGYGRETALLSPFFSMIYGIDVSETLFADMKIFLSERGVSNFSPILYRPGWEADLPIEADFIYSRNVIQHITRDLTEEYFFQLSKILKPGSGRIFFQFCECLDGGLKDVDLTLVYEPQVNWTAPEIIALCRKFNLEIHSLESFPLTEARLHFFWHFLSAGRGERS